MIYLLYNVTFSFCFIFLIPSFKKLKNFDKTNTIKTSFVSGANKMFPYFGVWPQQFIHTLYKDTLVQTNEDTDDSVTRKFV